MKGDRARRWRYLLDNTLERGSSILIFALAIGTLSLVFGISLLQYAFSDGNQSLLSRFFSGLMWTIAVDRDPTGDENTVFLKLTGGLFLLTGLVSVGVLIGVLTTGLSDRLESLRMGRSPVVEKNHTVLLGWSPQAIAIIEQLVIANESESRACVVVLADRSKLEMDDEIRSQLPDTKTTRVVTRRGDPMDMTDLQLAAIKSSKSIIIPAQEAEDSDADVIKILLAIVNDSERRKENYHIVAEVHDTRNAEVGEIVGGNEVEFVLTNDFLARLTAQTSRKSGLSAVYSEILDFEGQEIYFYPADELENKTFSDVLFSFIDAIPIGILSKNKKPLLNPKNEYVISKDDEIIVLAEDDSLINLGSGVKDFIENEKIQATNEQEIEPEHLIMIGWNRRSHMIIQQLDAFVPKGSEIVVAADLDSKPVKLDSFENLSIKVLLGDTTDRKFLEELEIKHVDRVIVLAYSERLDAQRADARSLITLMHLRDIARKIKTNLRISTEMMDLRNRRLAEVTADDDFVVSDRLISLTLAQISENKALSQVYTELFDATGCEIYLRPSSFYIRNGVEVNFATIALAARKRNEIALGWRRFIEVTQEHPHHGVVLNPKYNQKVSFSDGDRIVVIAED